MKAGTELVYAIIKICTQFGYMIIKLETKFGQFQNRIFCFFRRAQLEYTDKNCLAIQMSFEICLFQKR